MSCAYKIEKRMTEKERNGKEVEEKERKEWKGTELGISGNTKHEMTRLHFASVVAKQRAAQRQRGAWVCIPLNNTERRHAKRNGEIPAVDHFFTGATPELEARVRAWAEHALGTAPKTADAIDR